MRRFVRWTLVLAAVTLVRPAPAVAQGGGRSVNGLGDAILQLDIVRSGNLQRIQDQLFSGRIDATIINVDGDPTNFAGGDIVAFALASVSGVGSPLIFSGSRAAFDDWVEANADRLLAILFPSSLSESASGIDVAQSHSQAFLLSTALAAGGRGDIGGRLEFERFKVEGSSGNAVQALFRVNALAVEARFAGLNDSIRTRSTTVGVNVHPSYGQTSSSIEWRVGADGFFSALYATSAAFDLGSLDYGGGGWASGRKDYSRASVSVGTLLLGSKTHIPSSLIDEDFRFVADVVNERAIRWDLTYGGALQYLLTPQVSAGTKLLQTRSVKSATDAGRTSQLLLVSVAYLVGGDSPLDFGYRFSSGGERFSAHAVFMNANFTW